MLILMNITLQPLDSLKIYEGNPREIPKQSVDQVALSIKEHGFNQPIVTDEDMVICVGTTRYLASKKLGLKKVPVFVKKFRDKNHFLAYNIMDNKSGELSSWDLDKLALSFDELKDEEFHLSGFSDLEIEAITMPPSDSYDTGDYDDSTLGGDSPDSPTFDEDQIKVVNLYFSMSEYEKFLKFSGVVSKLLGTEKVSDTVMESLKKTASMGGNP